MEENYEIIEDESEQYPDAYAEDAKSKLREVFKDTQVEYCLKQLQVTLEKPYYHWVTGRAVKELIEERFLGFADEPLLGATKIKFLFDRRHRYFRRQMGEALEIVRAYSDPEIASACGRQAEMLFLTAFAERGFVVRGRNTNEFEGRKWIKTGHDLDFIIGKDGITYGCEVKNTWSYIDPKEMRTKLDICDFLGLVPCFIMRAAPKSYNEEIRQRGGVFVIFVAQVYPFAQSSLVGKIREKLGLPVDSPKEIPAGIIDRFMRVHRGRVRGV